MRSHILQGRNINVIRLILPSPESNARVFTSNQFSAVLRSADPRLARDLSMGEFVVAFRIFRKVVCSVSPQRRKGLDGYLALIGDLNLRYGKNMFYQYHKGFSSKAALHVSRSNMLLDWSVLFRIWSIPKLIGSCGWCVWFTSSIPVCSIVVFIVSQTLTVFRAKYRI